MKKFEFKQKRHMITAVCMLVGLMVLTTSVYANYDNANGYSNYKSAVKKLLLETDNVTLDANMEVYLDGELMARSENGAKFAKNGESSYNKEYTANDDDTYEYYTYRDGKMYYSYNAQTNTYYSYESDYTGIDGNFLGIDMDDNTSQKLVRFLEVGADMVVGDLKNNVVLIGEDDDTLEYEVNVSRNQMPEIINAGLSLMFSSMNQYSYNTQGVIYDDYNDTFGAFSKAEYGKDFANGDVYTDEGEFDSELAGYDTEEAYWEDYDEARQAFWDKYDSIFDDDYNGTGVMLVKADGSYDYYKTSDEYLDATNDYSGDDIYLLFGDDPYIESAKMTAKMSKSGELLENTLEVTLVGFDRNGEKHTATFKGAVNASDYGKTVADVFDPEGKEANNY